MLLSEFKGWELHFFLSDHVDKFFLTQIIGKEGHVAEEHLIEEDAEGPPVEREGVTLAFDHFRSHVLLGSANRFGKFSFLEVASHTKVYETDVAILAQHDIFQFEISVDDIAFVEVAERSNYLNCVELCI